MDRRYNIKGRGNLQFNADPAVGGRVGHGFCIEDLNIDFRRSYPPPKPIFYFFTEEEMEKYFITEHEYYKIESRDKKLKDLGI